MVESERGGPLRYFTTLAIVIAVLAMVGCGTLTLLPRQTDGPVTRVISIKDLTVAYTRIQPGETRATELAHLGFDPAGGNAQTLSYLGVMERFMPRDSVRFDRLDEAVRDCIEARDHCTALVFRTGDRFSAPMGNGILSAFGLGSSAAADRRPEVTLLVRNGRVAFKMISGMPTASVAHHDVAVQAPRDTPALMPASYRPFN
jgi:hypothetical protein